MALASRTRAGWHGTEQRLPRADELTDYPKLLLASPKHEERYMNVFPLLALSDSELAEFEDVDSVLRLSRVRTLSDMGPLLGGQCRYA